jgi:ABC-2 type transport system ATP-binding protein
LSAFSRRFFPDGAGSFITDSPTGLGLPKSHKIGNMSKGQRSQVVLGLIMAQQPEVMILDDYTMGLDAGYRRLFLDLLAEYLKKGEKTVLVTSHIVQDLERFVDELIFLECGGRATQMPLWDFLSGFKQYLLPGNNPGKILADGDTIKNVEESGGDYLLYSFEEIKAVRSYLTANNISCEGLAEKPMSFEDAFIGFTGRY